MTQVEIPWRTGRSLAVFLSRQTGDWRRRSPVPGLPYLFSFLCLCAAAVGLSSCQSSVLAPPGAVSIPDTEATSFIVDDVLVHFRKDRINDFQTTTLVWSGYVQNLGNRVPNARFEILSTRGSAERDGVQSKIESVQSFQDLLPGQQQLLHVSFTFPNTHELAISERFAHD